MLLVSSASGEAIAGAILEKWSDYGLKRRCGISSGSQLLAFPVQNPLKSERTSLL